MPSTLPPAIAHNIDVDVSAALKRFDAQGATIAVVDGTTVVYRHAFGFRRSPDLAANVDTHFGIGSITKQFTAAAIVQLEEAGELKFDDPVSRYLPAAPHASEITVRQLLTQTSGLAEYLDGPDLDNAMKKPATFDTLMARIAGKPLAFKPGTSWGYCNTNYIVLGRIIEITSGQSYQAYIQQHLLDPLGMTQTFTSVQARDKANVAAGYHLVDGRSVEVPETDEDAWGWSAGDLFSTADDLAKWSIALQSGKIVSPHDYDLMTTSQQLPNGDAGYGFALFVDSKYAQPRVGHTGGGFGYTAADEYYPKQHLRIIALTNAESDDPEAGETITNIIFADVHPELASQALASVPGEDKAITATARRAFLALETPSHDYEVFGDHLATKLRGGLGEQMNGQLGPFGTPDAFIFKGTRAAEKSTWYDYELTFGPGIMMAFGVRLDASGKVISISLG